MNILVTGGTGFLGKHLTRRLQADGHEVIAVSRGGEHHYDLTSELAVYSMMARYKPSVVIHAAADVGGIAYNQANPGSILYNNAMMGLLVLDCARRTGVQKVVSIGSACAYPAEAKVPTEERMLWEGYPEPTNGPYGIAKRLLLAQGQAYVKQYGMQVVHLVLTNMYGPHDNFEERGHVIPSLIAKFEQARKNGDREVVVWGSGYASRDFLYVEDAAEAITKATYQYTDPDPVNIASGSDIMIGDLAIMIRELTGYTGNITFDASKPDGQRRRQLSACLAKTALGFTPATSLHDGLSRTIEWYRANQAATLDQSES